MASYKVTFKPSVEKDLQALPKISTSRVMERLEQLAGDPFPSGSRKLASTERLYRIRVGKYRIVYEVDARARVVVVHYIRHRRDVYRNL